jgi:predicted signal transduction protein with EAL and GGDEF domain
MDTYAEVLSILAFFGSFWLSVTVITVTAMVLWHWRKSRMIEHGREIALEMLQRKMSAEEIERVLVAWSGNPSLARKVLEPKGKAA